MSTNTEKSESKKSYSISLYPKEDEIEKPSYFQKPEKPMNEEQRSLNRSGEDEG